MSSSRVSSSEVIYRERLWPGTWTWVLATALPVSLGIAYGAAYGVGVGFIVGAPATVLCLLGVVMASPVIDVTEGMFRAGRASIPRDVIRRAVVMDRSATKSALAMSPPDLWLLIRSWATSTAVLLEISDPEDPHTAWLISTRHPQRIIEALQIEPSDDDRPRVDPEVR